MYLNETSSQTLLDWEHLLDLQTCPSRWRCQDCDQNQLSLLWLADTMEGASTMFHPLFSCVVCPMRMFVRKLMLGWLWIVGDTPGWGWRLFWRFLSHICGNMLGKAAQSRDHRPMFCRQVCIWGWHDSPRWPVSPHLCPLSVSREEQLSSCCWQTPPSTCSPRPGCCLTPSQLSCAHSPRSNMPRSCTEWPLECCMDSWQS